MADEEDAPAPGPATAADIGAAILQGVQLLQQHSVEAPTFLLKDARDVYKEGVRAVKSRAPPARVVQQWVDAVSGAAGVPAGLSTGYAGGPADRLHVRAVPQCQHAPPRPTARLRAPQSGPRHEVPQDARVRAGAQTQRKPY